MTVRMGRVVWGDFGEELLGEGMLGSKIGKSSFKVAGN